MSSKNISARLLFGDHVYVSGDLEEHEIPQLRKSSQLTVYHVIFSMIMWLFDVFFKYHFRLLDLKTKKIHQQYAKTNLV